MGQFSKELQICLSTPIDKQSVHHISYVRTWLLHLDLDANAFFFCELHICGWSGINLNISGSEC